jgi:hypothetical protein
VPPLALPVRCPSPAAGAAHPLLHLLAARAPAGASPPCCSPALRPHRTGQLESLGLADHVHISQAAVDQLQRPGDFDIRPRGSIMSGKGEQQQSYIVPALPEVAVGAALLAVPAAAAMPAAAGAVTEPMMRSASGGLPLLRYRPPRRQDLLRSESEGMLLLSSGVAGGSDEGSEAGAGQPDFVVLRGAERQSMDEDGWMSMGAVSFASLGQNSFSSSGGRTASSGPEAGPGWGREGALAAGRRPGSPTAGRKASLLGFVARAAGGAPAEAAATGAGAGQAAPGSHAPQAKGTPGGRRRRQQQQQAAAPQAAGAQAAHPQAAGPQAVQPHSAELDAGLGLPTVGPADEPGSPVAAGKGWLCCIRK